MEYFLLFLLLALGVLFILAMRKPDTFVISRDVYIAASPAAVFAHLRTLRAQQAWSPFRKDPSMKETLSGPAEGVGSRYDWDGNNKVGAGHIEITGIRPDAEITLRLTMLRPMKAVNTVVLAVEPLANGSQSRVIWSMTGRQNFIGKVINTVIDCSKMVAKDFDAGLAKLKQLAEMPA